MNHELRQEVSQRVPFRAAYSKAETKDANTIAELIEEHRKPFSEGKVASIGAMTMASQETWAKIAEESEAAARRELLKNSAELSELERLERAAEEAQRLAEAKNAELSRLWSEYNNLPEKVEAINIRQAQIATELRSLEPEALKESFKSAFSALVRGASGSQDGLNLIAGMVATREWRVEVLEHLENELESELSGLRARSKVLAKKLGQK
jgi:hypothetical protein